MIQYKEEFECTVIVVTYNSQEYLAAVLNSLAEQTWKNFRIALVDNNSCDKSCQIAQEFAKNSDLKMELFFLNENKGFAAGNNYAYEKTQTPFIALLNPDAIAQSDWLENLMQRMERFPETGICASKLLRMNEGTIDSAGDGLSSILKFYKRGEKQDREDFSEEEWVYGACAGAALYRRDMIEDIGFFDEDFFIIHEDSDLNLRAQLMGWKIRYVPSAQVHHKVHGSIGAGSDISMFYSLRNSDFVQIKNIPFALILKYFPEVLMHMAAEIFYYTKRKKFRLYLKAKLEVFRYLPRLLKKRRTILKKRRVDNKYLCQGITLIWKPSLLQAKLRKLFFGIEY